MINLNQVQSPNLKCVSASRTSSRTTKNSTKSGEPVLTVADDLPLLKQEMRPRTQIMSHDFKADFKPN